MNRIFLIIASLFCTAPSYGQIELHIHAVLLKKDFSAFQKLADSFHIETNHITITRGNVRELVTGVQEAVFYVSKSYPLGGGVSVTCNPRIHILAAENTIIYFALESKRIEGLPDSLHGISDTTYRMTDVRRMKALMAEFRNVFGVDLNRQELFNDTVYYGRKCGHTGRDPEEQEQIDSWVTNLDTASLRNWLQSANTEKQMYAVQGFHRLFSKGMELPETTRKIMAYVVKKKGTMNNCIQCDASHTAISDVARYSGF